MVTVWWLYGASLYGDCMEPGRDMNPTIYVLTPLQFWGCFWTRLGILRSPMWFFSKKSEYWRNHKGGKFCSVPIESTIAKFSIHSIFISRMMAPRSFMAQLQFPLYRPATEFRNSAAGLYKGKCRILIINLLFRVPTCCISMLEVLEY